jgi:hypothetical protein
VLYIELLGLVVAGGYTISALFVMPDSISSEQALLLSMQ